MRALVFGSAGHIGRHLVPQLRELGHEVVEADRTPDHRPGFFCVDIRDGVDVQTAFHEAQPDVVYNLAGMVSRVTCEFARQAAVRANVDGALAVAQLALHHGARLVHYSTSEVYGPNEHPMRETDLCRPNNWYGMTKLLGDHGVLYLAEHFGLDCCVVRPFMLYHEDEVAQDNRSAMIRFVRDVVEGNRFTLHAETARNWLYMEDATAFMAQLASGHAPQILNIGHPDLRTMDALVCLIGELAGETPVYDVVPCPDRMTPYKRPDLTRQLDLGMVPTVSLEEGVRRVIDGYRSRIG